MAQAASKTTFAQVAGELDAAWQFSARLDGSKYWAIKTPAPEWMADENSMGSSTSDFSRGFHEVLDDRMPDDWVFEVARAASESIAGFDSAEDAREHCDSGYFAEDAVSIWTSDAFAWAQRADNRALCDDAADGYPKKEINAITVEEWIRRGMAYAAERIYLYLVDAVEVEADSRD